ncbi:MAG: hypothetical protein M1840_000501 [Geoglossum simile]|nr:MAG: hypothetical protein M1840_000501 [Geoglossum simile]
MYALQEVPGKGGGLVATRKIPMGTRILSEEPVIRVPGAAFNGQTLLKSVRRQTNALTPDQRRAFLSMHNIHHADDTASRYLGIVRTNTLPLGGDVGERSWNENIKQHTVHALRDIEKSKEITIYYLGVLNNHESRESDRRLDEIFKLDVLISRDGLLGILSAPLHKLRYVDQQIRLYNEQGPDDNGLPRAFFDAAQIAITNGDQAKARIFAERAAVGSIVLGGDDSPSTLQYRALSRDPSEHELYGMSMKWKTAVDEVPQGLDPKEFEDWLWRGRSQNGLDSRTTFPGFIDLPDENDVSSGFYASSGESNYRPRRHWLFLAEIVDFAALLRLQVDIKDVDGMAVPLFFYTDGCGSELAPSQVQKGHTIAILYAQRHAFKFSEPGIRHEEPTNIKDNKFRLRFLTQRVPTDISAIAKQVASIERPGPKILGGNE